MKPPLPTTDDNQTLLHIASYNGMLHIVKYLCKKFPSITSALDNEGSLATHYAARGNDVQMLQFLLDQGLRPDAGTQSGSTILHLAAYDGNADMVSYLCEKYPQLIHVQDTTGYSAAHYAAGSGNIPLLLNILQYGIDPHIKSSNGSTLLLKAVYNGRKPMVKYLCTEYPDLISMTDAFGCNVLHYAACDGNVKIIQYMIDKGVNPASRTNDGHTILHVAAFHGQLEVIRQICEDYPNLVHVKDNSGKTAEETATEHNRTKAANLIRSLSVVNQVEITDSVLLSDVCCCLGTNCFGGIWRAIGNICCCDRRGQ
jgi:ankyrin repeat protein